MLGDKGNRVWDEVRRAMGRLANRAAVHEIAPQGSFRAVVKRSAAAGQLTATRGTHEEDWHPQTESILWSSPYAGEGGDGADLVSVSSIISANGAMRAELNRVQCPSWRVENRDLPRTKDLSQAVLTVPKVAAPPTRFARAEVRGPFESILPGAVYRVSVPRLGLEKKRRNDKMTPWTLKRPRTRADLGIIARLPIIRENLTAPLGQSTEELFATARRKLADSAHVSESDVVLVGIFPQVPLSMVQKLSVIADGGTRLQIWLKPDAVKAGPGGVKLATIILGRQKSTGNTLQAVSRSIGLNTGSR